MPLFGRKKPSLQDMLDPEWVIMFEVIFITDLKEKAPFPGMRQYEELLERFSMELNEYLRNHPGDPEAVDNWRRQYMDDYRYARLVRGQRERFHRRRETN